MLPRTVIEGLKNPLTAARFLGLLIFSSLMLPVSPLYGQTGGSYDAPGTHTEDEGELEQDKELPYTILTRQRLETPYGNVEFGVMRYSTPEGDTCFDTAVADSSALVGKAGGGYCANAPLGGDEHIRASMGSQLLFFKPPSAEHGLDTSISAPPIPYYTTDISGNVSSKVSSVTTSYTADGVTQSFSVAPQNGAFLIVLPGYIEAPEVTVEALSEKGKALQTIVVMNCLDPSCEPTTPES